MVDMAEAALDHGDVLIRVLYSSVNHRDVAGLTGRERLVRRLPCVGGCDLAGVVVSSASPRFVPGMSVLATGYELGRAHHGGWAGLALVPGGWVFAVPDGLDCRSTMQIGTTGLAAAMAITRLEENGLRPERGPVLISGASGGVGSLAIDMLAGRGYEVVALTRHRGQDAAALVLGASSCLGLEAFLQEQAGQSGMGKARWAGAIDVLGGAVLGQMLGQIKPSGVLACVGAAGGKAYGASAEVFATRGVSVLGVDTTHAGFSVREHAWGRLGADLKPRHLERMSAELDLEALPPVLKDFAARRCAPRMLVRVTPGWTGRGQT